MKPRALILHANGTNRDHEAALAFEQAGAQPEIVPLKQLRARRKYWSDFQLLVLPGGFAYADALGAGKLLALDLNAYFADEVHTFIESGKLVIGICNGFQALVKAGLIPFSASGEVSATLAFNDSGHFECRWVTLVPQSKACLWTRELREPIYCPVAHGEGKFVLKDSAMLDDLRAHDQIALTYASPDEKPAEGTYPYNPNGSLADIAGICNREGNVLGLMPHPEDHIFSFQHPRWTRGERGLMGSQLFKSGVDYAAAL